MWTLYLLLILLEEVGCYCHASNTMHAQPSTPSLV